MRARERFDATREAVGELHEVQLRLSEGGDDWRPPGIRGGSIPDPTASQASYNIDHRRQVVSRLRRLERDLTDFIGETLVLIGFVRDRLGEGHADTLEARFIDCRQWRDVESEGKPVPRSTGKAWIREACELIDSIGASRIIEGKIKK